MNSRVHLQVRVVAAMAAAVFFLLAATVRQQWVQPLVASRAPVVHVICAVFGAAFVVQAYLLARPLRAPASRS